MDLQIKILPPSLRPDPIMPHPKMYELMGEAGVRKMVSDHYELLVESKIKDMFPPKGYSLEQAKERSADFFIQKLGGPDYFNQHRGAPKLSQRHSYFKVTPEGRVTWLECYREVLLKQDLPEEVIEKYWAYLHDFSNWMVNTPSNNQQMFSL
ncbi:MAG: globin [Salinivirgaceae bacterium]|jgi:hemoglobin|nr:globin [Salinivirgaceae bacterium]